MAVTPDQFKDVLRFWASGVTIVTTRRQDGIQGITVSSFASLSLEPPLVLVCIESRARSHEAIAAQRCFVVNILESGQEDLSECAAARRGAEGAWLLDVAHHTAVTGAPVIEGALAWLDCSLAATHAGGDHTIFVGRVEAGGGGGGQPLVWFDRGYTRLVR
ncbi:MAG TPA: flavin reductase family protein [Candidatus Cryosericum sp.]|nr:flavin reductase family protein [Candidatus Cryosericum sp.]